MKKSYFILISALILVLMNQNFLYSENSDWARLSLDKEARSIIIESELKCVLEVKQGGKKVFSQCVTKITDEVFLTNKYFRSGNV